MEIMPNLQLVIIVSILAVLLILSSAVIFYKLGKRSKEKIKENKSQKESNENIPLKNPVTEPLKAAGDKRKNSEVSIIDGDEIMLYQQKKEKKVAPSELSSKKIEQEISSKEKNVVKENKTADSKFLKYTSDGYKPVKGDKKSGTLGWR